MGTHARGLEALESSSWGHLLKLLWEGLKLYPVRAPRLMGRSKLELELLLRRLGLGPYEQDNQR